MENDKRKSGFVAFVGRPNVGKSTLMNTLIGQKIAITSDKPQTTRNRIQTIYTDERGQIVFLDTPGIHKAKNKLGDYMVKVAINALKDVDVILWLVEAKERIGKGEEHILEILAQVKKPVVLAINKMDRLNERAEILKDIERFSEFCDFAQIVPVSALKRQNTEELLKVLFQNLPEGPMYYDEDVVTDQPVRQIAAEIVREKALRFLKDEIPHGIAVEINRYERKRGGLIEIEADIVCEREAHKKIIIGNGGSMIKRIGMAARRDMENMEESKIHLKLFVKVRKEWRDSDIQMKNFGFTD